MANLELLLAAWTLLRDRLRILSKAVRELAADGRSLTHDDQWRFSDPRELADWRKKVDLVNGQVSIVFDIAERLIARTNRMCPDGLSGELDSARWECVLAFQELNGLGDDLDGPHADLTEQLLAAEMGERFADESGVAVNSVLRDWQIHSLDLEHRAALMQLLIRKPRGRGAQQRWRELVRQEGPEGIVRWLHKAIRGIVLDRHRRVPWKAMQMESVERTPARAIAPSEGGEASGAYAGIENSKRAAEILALIDAAALSPTLQEVAIAALLLRENPAETARRLGVRPGTIRVRRHRMFAQLQAAVATSKRM